MRDIYGSAPGHCPALLGLCGLLLPLGGLLSLSGPARVRLALFSSELGQLEDRSPGLREKSLRPLPVWAAGEGLTAGPTDITSVLWVEPQGLLQPEGGAPGMAPGPPGPTQLCPPGLCDHPLAPNGHWEGASGTRPTPRLPP